MGHNSGSVGQHGGNLRQRIGSLTPQGQCGTPQGQFGTPQGQFGTPQGQFGTVELPSHELPRSVHIHNYYLIFAKSEAILRTNVPSIIFLKTRVPDTKSCE